jgi:GNAT superfamily N-acetyltransferase
MSEATLRRLDATDAERAAGVHRAAFDDRLPWLRGLHTPDEDRWFWRERVFPSCTVWGAAVDGALVGVIAFRKGWVEQLYVLPEAQGRGVGTALLAIAKSAHARLSLWAFQSNSGARRFYEKQGFVAVRERDGSMNEEQEPDVLYVWSR